MKQGDIESKNLLKVFRIKLDVPLAMVGMTRRLLGRAIRLSGLGAEICQFL